MPPASSTHTPDDRPRMTRIAGLLEPHRLDDRERRPVPGLEDRYSVTRTGRVYSAHKRGFMVDAYNIQFEVGGQPVMGTTAYLVALAWLTAHERANVRAACVGLTRRGRRAAEDALGQKYGVTPYAVRFVADIPEEDFQPIAIVPQEGLIILPEPPRVMRANNDLDDDDLLDYDDYND